MNIVSLSLLRKVLIAVLFVSMVTPVCAQEPTQFISSQNATFFSVGDSWYQEFTLSGTRTFVLRFASDYACDAAVLQEKEKDNFINNLGFSAFASFSAGYGTKSVTLGAGTYYLCVRSRSDGENTYSVELDYDLVLADDDQYTYSYAGTIMNEATSVSPNGGSLTHGFTIQEGYRYFIDGCNSGMETYIIPDYEVSAFQSGSTFQYYDAYSSPEADGSYPGLYEVKLQPGTYYLAFRNSTAIRKSTVYIMEVWREKWTPVNMTVFFDAQGGSSGTTAKTVTRGLTYGSLPVPTRSGYTFGGWWNGSGFQVTSSDTVTLSGNHTLYAKWIPVAGPIITTASPLPSGVVGFSYGFAVFSATGGTTPYKWSVASGSPPVGISLSSGGLLSGTPTVAGTAVFTVKVADANQQSSTMSFTMTVDPRPELSVTPVSHNVTKDAGSITFSIANVGGGSLTWSATVISGGPWVGLSGSPGLLTVTYDANPSGGPVRTATIRVTAAGATGSPIEVSLTQEANMQVETCSATVGVKFEYSLYIMAGSATKVTVGGLPAGLKYNATSSKIEGVPLQAGEFTVRVYSAGNLLGAVLMEVTALPVWAQGDFNGFYANGGRASMLIGSKGRVIGSVITGGVTYWFAANSYEAGGDEILGFSITTVAKAGSVSWPLTLKVTKAVAPGLPSLGYAYGKIENGAAKIRMWRDVWKELPGAMVPFVGYYTATLPGGSEYGSGYLTMTIDAAARFKVAGRLADGTSVSMSGTLVADGDGTLFAVVYSSPKAYKGGHIFGLAEIYQAVTGEVALGKVGFNWPFVWYNKDPQATANSGYGFYRETGFYGGRYNTTENLYAYYADKNLTAGVNPDVSTPALEVDGVRYGPVKWGPEGVKLTPVFDSYGAMSGLAAPPVGTPVDPERDGVWDYSEENTVGLKFSLKRATGLFKGYFKAWYDYPVKKHSSASFPFEGVLLLNAPSHEVGILGRGFFLLPDKAMNYATGKEYRFKWSYDFLLKYETGFEKGSEPFFGKDNDQ